jgi:hypothetical protein
VTWKQLKESPGIPDDAVILVRTHEGDLWRAHADLTQVHLDADQIYRMRGSCDDKTALIFSMR